MVAIDGVKRCACLVRRWNCLMRRLAARRCAPFVAVVVRHAVHEKLSLERPFARCSKGDDGAYRPLPGDASHLLIPNSQQINLESPAAAENVLPCIFEAARLQQQLLVAFQI